MKNLIFVSLFLTLILISGCQTQSVSTSSPKKETVLCNPTKFLQECDMLIEEFLDLNERASSTSRIALSPVIGEMQDVKRRFKYLEEPSFCTNTADYKDAVVQGMEYTIQAYLDFMAEKEYMVETDMELAGDKFEKAKEYRALIK